MIPVVITAVASILVAIIGLLNRRAVKQSGRQNSDDHALVVEAIAGLRGDVRQVHDMIWTHVTDSSLHPHSESGLRSSVANGGHSRPSWAPDPSRINGNAPILEADVQASSDRSGPVRVPVHVDGRRRHRFVTKRPADVFQPKAL